MDCCGLQCWQTRGGTGCGGRMLTDDQVFIMSNHTFNNQASREDWIQQDTHWFLISATLVQWGFWEKTPDNYGVQTWENARCAFLHDRCWHCLLYLLMLPWTGEVAVNFSSFFFFFLLNFRSRFLCRCSWRWGDSGVSIQGRSDGFKHLRCSWSYDQLNWIHVPVHGN